MDGPRAAAGVGLAVPPAAPETRGDSSGRPVASTGTTGRSNRRDRRRPPPACRRTTRRSRAACSRSPRRRSSSCTPRRSKARWAFSRSAKSRAVLAVFNAAIEQLRLFRRRHRPSPRRTPATQARSTARVPRRWDVGRGPARPGPGPRGRDPRERPRRVGATPRGGRKRRMTLNELRRCLQTQPGLGDDDPRGRRRGE